VSQSQVSKIKHCEQCGYTGAARREGRGLVWLAALMWLVPLAFLSFGFWPFFLFPAIAISAWAYMAYQSRCPGCGALLD